MLGGVVCSTLRTFLADNAGIGLPLGIEWVIRIGSKTVGYTAVNIGNSHILKKMLKISFFLTFWAFFTDFFIKIHKNL